MDSCRSSWVKKKYTYMCLEFKESEMEKEKMKQKLVKALKKIGILQLESIVHKPASMSLAAQKEQVIAEKKIAL